MSVSLWDNLFGTSVDYNRSIASINEERASSSWWSSIFRTYVDYEEEPSDDDGDDDDDCPPLTDEDEAALQLSRELSITDLEESSCAILELSKKVQDSHPKLALQLERVGTILTQVADRRR